MLRKIFFFLNLFLISSFLQATDLPETKIEVVGTWSMLHVYKNFEQPFWKEKIPKLSNYKIKTDVKSFNEMGLKGPEVVRLMKSGVISFGSTLLGYIAGDSPMNEAIDLAKISKDVTEARKITESFKPALSEFYKKRYKIKLLAVYPYGLQSVFCNKKIKNIDSLKGLKVRTYSKTQADFFSALGSNPVSISFGETPQALQKGVIDCALTGVIAGWRSKWYESANYLYSLSIGYGHVISAVSYKRWNKLHPDIRKFIFNDIKQLEDLAWKSVLNEEKNRVYTKCLTGGKCSLGKSANMKLTTLSKYDLKKINNIVENEVLPNWGKRAGNKIKKQFNATIAKIIGKSIK